MPVGEIATAEELCSPQLLKKTEFYQDFLRPYNINLFCAVPTENRSPALEIVTFYHQGWDAKPRDSAVLDTIRLLVPHLKSALRTRRHLCALERQTKDFSSALDLLEFGILLLDEKGRSLFINKAAKEICDRKDGLVFRDGRLWAESPSESRRLRSLIDRAVQTGTGRETFAGGALSISRLAQNPLQILVSPFTARTHLLTVTRQTMAVVFVSDPDRTSVSAEHMMRLLHGLTAAETELLRLLLAGYDVSEMAGLRAVSRETIRTQIKSIFSKTGTRRQSELVRLAATLPRVNPTA
jgi:DNA-binding CsgD family transcriptional regulator